MPTSQPRASTTPPICCPLAATTAAVRPVAPAGLQAGAAAMAAPSENTALPRDAMTRTPVARSSLGPEASHPGTPRGAERTAPSPRDNCTFLPRASDANAGPPRQPAAAAGRAEPQVAARRPRCAVRDRLGLAVRDQARPLPRRAPLLLRAARPPASAPLRPRRGRARRGLPSTPPCAPGWGVAVLGARGAQPGR